MIEFVRALVPAPYRILLLLAIVGGVWLHGYLQGRSFAAGEIAAAEAVATAESARYRKLEKEVADAQAVLVEQFNTLRAGDRAEWDRIRLRLEARPRGVPAVPAECRSPAADQGNGLETPGGPGGGDLSVALVDALQVGEQLERTLQLCQAELRACAGMTAK